MEQLNTGGKANSHWKMLAQAYHSLLLTSNSGNLLPNREIPASINNGTSSIKPNIQYPGGNEINQQQINNYVNEQNKNIINELNKKMCFIERKQFELQQKNEFYEKMILDLINENKNFKARLDSHDIIIDKHATVIDVTSNSLYNCIHLFNEDTNKLQKHLEDNSTRINFIMHNIGSTNFNSPSRSIVSTESSTSIEKNDSPFQTSAFVYTNSNITNCLNGHPKHDINNMDIEDKLSDKKNGEN
ncbi:Hypothetical protein SRAE_2000485400 [Strongyloides ratti]|uniref:Uncharacterized protein n=1 Tax=Strongyloides ratti TaxID=34506 RepID=A0A090N080_STRRB|nr:Hypothetical protein SRAE_2000485400 [Strongyloides ratti]CEF70220.1 Hypothetical protein SRAE_2000485400 [Strongyloides ratti]